MVKNSNLSKESNRPWLQPHVKQINHLGKSPEEGGNANAHRWARGNLMPVVGWDVCAITLLNMDCLDDGVPRKRILFKVWCDEFQRTVVVWVTLGSWIDPWSWFWGSDTEILVSLINAHHVLHCIGMWSGQGSISVPVGDLWDIKQSIHYLWQFQIFV